MICKAPMIVTTRADKSSLSSNLYQFIFQHQVSLVLPGIWNTWFTKPQQVNYTRPWEVREAFTASFSTHWKLKGHLQGDGVNESLHFLRQGLKVWVTSPVIQGRARISHPASYITLILLKFSTEKSTVWSANTIISPAISGANLVVLLFISTSSSSCGKKRNVKC